jgi:hypothetical protein
MDYDNGSSVEGVFTSTRISGGVSRLKYTTQSVANETIVTKTAAIQTFDLRAGVLAASAFQSGSFVSIAASVSETVSPEKAMRPVSIS